MSIRKGLALAVIACAFVVTGCGGGGGAGSGASSGGARPAGNTGSDGVVPAVATPTPSPTPGTLTLSVSSLEFTAVGSAATFTADQPLFFGNFTVASLSGHPCAGIATVSPSSVPGPNPTFTVTAAGHGTCVILVTGGAGETAQETVIVTTTTGSISAKVRN